MDTESIERVMVQSMTAWVIIGTVVLRLALWGILDKWLHKRIRLHVSAPMICGAVYTATTLASIMATNNSLWGIYMPLAMAALVGFVLTVRLAN